MLCMKIRISKESQGLMSSALAPLPSEYRQSPPFPILYCTYRELRLRELDGRQPLYQLKKEWASHLTTTQKKRVHLYYSCSRCRIINRKQIAFYAHLVHRNSETVQRMPKYFQICKCICQLLPVVVEMLYKLRTKSVEPIQIIRGIRGVTAVLYIAKSSKKPLIEVFCKIFGEFFGSPIA